VPGRRRNVMNKRKVRFWIGLLGVWMAIAGPVWGAEDEAKAARGAFEAYLDALSRKNGRAAAGAITSDTLEHYEKLRVAALGARAEEVRRLGLMDQVFLLILRAEVEPKELRRWSAPELFAESVQRGWMDPSAVARASLGKVAVRGNLAAAKMTADGQELPFEWRFEREKGVWKNDLLHVLRFVQAVITQQVKASGKDENQFVREAVEGALGRKVPPTLWDPPASSARSGM
jgi:hypothetical protein